MITCETVAELRSNLKQVRDKRKTIGFVATMGALHRGHLSLIDVVRKQCDFVVMSIFVNPLQFNSRDDLVKYPRPVERDLDQAASAGVDLLFLPTDREIYPDLMQGDGGYTKIVAGSRALRYEGQFRPGHFDGVVTVVSILFNLIAPDVAVFGEKDYQQLKVIEQMSRDLRYGVRVISAPIVRDNDGLALSSRNERLDTAGRLRALAISQALFWAKDQCLKGQRNVMSITSEIRRRLEREGSLRVDYVAAVDPETLSEVATFDQDTQLLVAAFVDDVRLIDNIRISPQH